MDDKTLSERDRQKLLDQLKNDGLGDKRPKRSQLTDYKSEGYMATERP